MIFTEEPDVLKQSGAALSLNLSLSSPSGGGQRDETGNSDWDDSDWSDEDNTEV